ncbi:MAG: hypothetical protein FXF54_11730 [Kosmotoga sp.]|nr:MAG: hypothetical protein FXF54_11730 [Kosmotoga sp.]
MDFSLEQTMTVLKKLYSYMSNENFRNKFWFDFPEIPIALYDKEKVFIAGFPRKLENFTEQNGILVGKKDNRFYGNTAIELEGKQVAIWDLTTIEPSISFGRLLSLIFHEAFHGYQKIKGEKRWANELQILEYPFTERNLALRFLERRELLNVVFSSSEKELRQNLSKFINLRESRRKLISDSMNYELAQESIEGTAIYVETKVYSQCESLPPEYVIALQGKNMGGLDLNPRRLRLSCYAPGMFIAFILDRIDNHWQEKYVNSEKYIYDFMRQLAGITTCKTYSEEIPHDVIERSKKILERYNGFIDEKFSEFENSNGYKIILKGNFPLMGMDPMNIIWKDQYILNEHFFATQFNKTKIFIRKQNKVKRIGKEYRFCEITFFSNEKPEKKGEKVSIPGVGIVEAELKESNDEYHIFETSEETDVK